MRKNTHRERGRGKQKGKAKRERDGWGKREIGGGREGRETDR